MRHRAISSRPVWAGSFVAYKPHALGFLLLVAPAASCSVSPVVGCHMRLVRFALYACAAELSTLALWGYYRGSRVD